MNISKRTAQNWRDEGKIAFSQIGGKIYYRYGDIEALLKQHYNRAFLPTLKTKSGKYNFLNLGFKSLFLICVMPLVTFFKNFNEPIG